MDGATQCPGRVRPFQVITTPRSSLWLPAGPWHKNLVTRQWGAIVGPLLRSADVRYRLSTMFFEFMNVASPGDPVSLPSLDRSRTIQYYNDLASDPSRDYLRVPVLASTFTSTDETLYPGGNLLTLFGRSDGTTGVHGKLFDADHHSVVYGIATVATVDIADATQDLIFSSAYLDSGSQLPKTDNSQLALSWEIPLT